MVWKESCVQLNIYPWILLVSCKQLFCLLKIKSRHLDKEPKAKSYERGTPYFASFRHHMMLISSPWRWHKCSLLHSLTIKNDFGWAANQHHLQIRKLYPMILSLNLDQCKLYYLKISWKITKFKKIFLKLIFFLNVLLKLRIIKKYQANILKFQNLLNFRFI